MVTLLENIRTMHIHHAEHSKITLVCGNPLYFNSVFYDAAIRG